MADRFIIKCEEVRPSDNSVNAFIQASNEEYRNVLAVSKIRDIAIQNGFDPVCNNRRTDFDAEVVRGGATMPTIQAFVNAHTGERLTQTQQRQLDDLVDEARFTLKRQLQSMHDEIKQQTGKELTITVDKPRVR